MKSIQEQYNEQLAAENTQLRWENRILQRYLEWKKGNISLRFWQSRLVDRPRKSATLNPQS